MSGVGERVLVGRDAELAKGRAALERVRAARSALVLFAGEAGIGKTSLADAIADEAARSGVAVAWGRCWEAGGAPAYWPWTQAFRALGLEDPFVAVSEAPTNEANEIRFRLFDRAAEALRQRTRDEPVLVVLDDLHAADVPSLLFLQLVAKGLRLGGKLGILGTYRDAEARVAGEVGTLLARIARDGELLAPARLSAREVSDWVRAERPDATPETVARVHEVSEGNPLFVAELLRLRTNLELSSLPDGLRAILEEHLARVGPETRALLELASVLGREWDVTDAGALAGLSADVVATRVAEARDAGVVTSLGSAKQAFAHMLIRDVLYAGLAPSRRTSLHEAAGERLAAGGDLEAAAHHLFEAGAHGRAAVVAREAVRVALARLAFEDALRLANRALEVADPVSEIACELTLLSAEALIRMGATREGMTSAIRAAELATKIGAPRLLARATLVHGAEIITGTQDRTQIELLRRARRALGDGDDVLLARVNARLASALVPPMTPEDWQEAQDTADAALATARRLDDEETLLFVLRFVASAKGYGVPTRERYALAREVVELAEKLDRRLVLIDVLGFWAAAQREAGELEAMKRTLDRWTVFVREHSRPQYAWRVPMVLGLHAMLDGDVASGERLVEEGVRVAEESGTPGGKVAWMLSRISNAFLRDDFTVLRREADRLRPMIQMAHGMFGPIETVLVGVAEGRVDEARAQLSAITPSELGELLLPRLSMLAMSVAALRDREVAARLVDELQRFAADSPIFWGAHGSTMMGPMSLYAARICVLAGRPARARELYDETSVLASRLASPLLRAIVDKERAALEDALPPSSHAPPPPSRGPSSRHTITIEHEGETWCVRSSLGARVTVKDGKGAQYLAELVRAEGRELHVTQLVGIDDAQGDAGPVLDAKAKAAYKERLEDLRDRLEEARKNNDVASAERAEAELDAIAEQLAGAVGLGGRDRKTGSHVERARINVQRRLKDVLRRIADHDPHLARYLEASIKTGTWCSFRPP
jgi:tetratricopeptide (TPR) repeat protein